MTNKNKYVSTLRLLHWAMAVIVIFIIAIAFVMTNLPKEYSHLSSTLFFWHKSCGVLILGLILLRIAVRFFSYVPPMPQQIAKWERRLAYSVHLVMYFLMLALPILGIVMTALFGYEVPFFDFGSIPVWLNPNKDLGSTLASIHVSLGIIFAILILGHISASLYLYLRYKINLLKRIV